MDLILFNQKVQRIYMNINFILVQNGELLVLVQGSSISVAQALCSRKGMVPHLFFTNSSRTMLA